MTSKIKECVIKGFTYKKTQQELKISPSTWDEWVTANYQGFRDKLHQYDLDYQLSLAQYNLKKVLQLQTLEPVIGMFGPIIDKKTRKPVIKENDKLLKIKTDVSTFMAETIGKSDYSKKQPLDDVDDVVMVVLKK